MMGLFARIHKASLVSLIAASALVLLMGTHNKLLGLSSLRRSYKPYFFPGNTTRPPLSQLLALQDDNTTSDAIQALLDFGIIGHPKTATTFLLEWFGQQAEIKTYGDEVYALQQGNMSQFIELMYALPAGDNYKRGYKAPRDICNTHILDVYRQHFGKTKLIVGLRHPVLWLESFYNYRTRKNVTLPPADSPLLIGPCTEPVHGVCTDESLFHYHLALLGKVNITGSLSTQVGMLSPNQYAKLTRYLAKHEALPNSVFLYDINQLRDTNATRAAIFRQDLSEFLQLQRPLSDWVREKGTRVKLKVLNICESKYLPLRTELMTNARAASTWIRTYFLNAPGVSVSSREYLESILLDWMVDPCIERNSKADTYLSL